MVHELLECGDTAGTVTAVEALERPTNDLNVLPRRRLDLDLLPRRSRARRLARHGQRGGRRGQRHRGESGKDYPLHLFVPLVRNGLIERP
jgi:hypothetical protein